MQTIWPTDHNTDPASCHLPLGEALCNGLCGNFPSLHMQRHKPVFSRQFGSYGLCFDLLVTLD